MMDTRKAKRLSAGGAVVALIVAFVTVLLVLGGVLLRSRTGADPADAFSEIPPIPALLEDLVRWEPDVQPLARTVEPNTRALVEAAWVRGWNRLDAAQRTGSPDGLDTWFLPGIAGHASTGATAGPAASIHQHAHDLKVTFYSLDGSIMTLDATSDLERRVVGGPPLRSKESFEVVLLLSDGNWRVLHLTRIAAEPLDKPLDMP